MFLLLPASIDGVPVHWLDGHVFDLRAYGKFVDNVSQNLGAPLVGLGAQSITVQGIGESRYGAAAGAAASVSLNGAMRLYADDDAEFRSLAASTPGDARPEPRR
jgi:hypothetical protein